MKHLSSALIVFWLIACGSLPLPPAWATKPHSDFRPLDGFNFPLTYQGRVLTSLRRSFPDNPGIPLGPSVDEASKAVLNLPFTLAMVSDLDIFPAPPSLQAPLALHGRFRPGLLVAVLSGVHNAFCPALTGNAISTENIYGVSFAATSLNFPKSCPANFQAFLAVTGLINPDYRRISPRPVRDPTRVIHLKRLAATAPGLKLNVDEDLAPSPGKRNQRLPLASLDRLRIRGKTTFLLTYGGITEDQPASLILIRNGKPSQVWLGCGAHLHFFSLNGFTFLAWYYQDCGSGRRGLYVYLLDGETPMPVYVNADFSG